MQELCRLNDLPEPPDLEMLTLSQAPFFHNTTSPSAMRALSSSSNEGRHDVRSTSGAHAFSRLVSGGGYASSSGRGSSGSGSACSSSPAREEEVDSVQPHADEEDEEEEEMEEDNDEDEDLNMELEEDEGTGSGAGKHSQTIRDSREIP